MRTPLPDPGAGDLGQGDVGERENRPTDRPGSAAVSSSITTRPSARMNIDRRERSHGKASLTALARSLKVWKGPTAKIPPAPRPQLLPAPADRLHRQPSQPGCRHPLRM